MKLVAIDPGVTTGIASIELKSWWKDMGEPHEVLKKALDGSSVGWFAASDIKGTEFDQVTSMMAIIYGSFRFEGPDAIASIVAVESFDLRERTKAKSLLAPVRITARLQDRLQARDFKGEFRNDGRHSPSSAKSIVTDERLREWGLWVPGSPHVRDAMRHLLVLMRSI
jgi:hypothetical protein